MPRFRIALFGMTGFGNAVMRAVLASGHELLSVVTREETGPYPYYNEQNIEEEARGHGISVLHGSTGEAAVTEARPDLILVATYHRIIAPEIIRSAPHAFNIHPSLLPRYRGTTPYFWAMRNDEKTTGVTIHDLTGVLDRGDILLQNELPIRSDDTQGSLRKALAGLAYTSVLDLLVRLSNNTAARTPQREELATYNPRPQEEDRALIFTETAEQVCRHVRALLPYPKAIIKDHNCRVEAVVATDKADSTRMAPGAINRIGEDLLQVRVADAVLTLRISAINDGRA